MPWCERNDRVAQDGERIVRVEKRSPEPADKFEEVGGTSAVWERWPGTVICMGQSSGQLRVVRPDGTSGQAS